MEVLSKNSRIKTAAGTSSIYLAESVLSFTDSYFRDIETNTPSDANTRILSFSILPSMNSELYPSEGVVVTEWKVTTSAGQPIPGDEQIGCIQAFGVFAYSRCILKIGGDNFLPSFPMNHHALFHEMITRYDPDERKTLLYSIGWREDSINKRGANKPHLDPNFR